MDRRTKNKGGRKPRYSTSFMREVVRAVKEQNLSYGEAAKQFGLSSRTMLQGWYRKYGNELVEAGEPEAAPSNQSDESAEQKRIQELEKALDRANLKILGLETMIDVAEEELKIDIRKKSGTKPSNS